MIRGWCPSLFRPMQSGDGWLMRIKPFAARLPAEAARRLAAAAQRHGNGWLGLTNRGNVQARGLTEAATLPFAEAMLAAGLALPDPAAEARRNLLLPPLLGADPALDPRLPALAAALQDVLCRAEGLPGKFGLVLDGGGVLPLAAERADIHVTATGAAIRIAQGGTVAACGWDAAPAAVARLLAASRTRTRGPADPAPPPVCIGPLPGAFGIGLPLGRLHASVLSALADLSERHADGALRITPWRSLVLAGQGGRPATELAAAVAALGGIVDPADPRCRIVACPGHPACASGTVDTAAAAAAALARGFAGLLHVSGCAKGCAHPAPAPWTVVGDSGRFALVRDGTAAAPPLHRGLSARQVAECLARP